MQSPADRAATTFTTCVPSCPESVSFQSSEKGKTLKQHVGILSSSGSQPLRQPLPPGLDHEPLPILDGIDLWTNTILQRNYIVWLPHVLLPWITEGAGCYIMKTFKLPTDGPEASHQQTCEWASLEWILQLPSDGCSPDLDYSLVRGAEADCLAIRFYAWSSELGDNDVYCFNGLAAG